MQCQHDKQQGVSFSISLLLRVRSQLQLCVFSLSHEFQIQQKDNEEVTKFMTMLDENGDGRVDFKEYVVFVVSLAMINNSSL